MIPTETLIAIAHALCDKDGLNFEVEYEDEAAATEDASMLLECLYERGFAVVAIPQA